MARKNNKPSWILSYKQRKKVSRKFKTTQQQIDRYKQNGDWSCASKLSRLLRNVWWGIKRYRDK